MELISVWCLVSGVWENQKKLILVLVQVQVKIKFLNH
jgi:hypothetical protein